jgi:ABC-type nickel/cobalt efflux system permease component RcnA
MTYFDFPILLGMTAAIAHVLMGPDHLAAVTPLVFDTKKRHWRIGFSWGIGHIFGMLLIGVLFYFFKDMIPVEAISTYSEQFVGLILIGIGFWSFYRIKNRKKKHRHPHFHDNTTKMHIHKHEHHKHNHAHDHATQQNQNYLTAIGIGTIHGFAGIAHFVLLLPVLGFDSKLESAQYIIGFAIGIVLAMVLYTALISKLKIKVSDISLPMYKNLQFWSGIFAVVVGVIWIVSNS